MNGRELWKSDGTETGTVLVKDIKPGSTSTSLIWLTALGGTLFFTADDGVSGREVWKSDGTESGTVLVLDLFPGSSSSIPTALTVVGGVLFFDANDGATGGALWKHEEILIADLQVLKTDSPDPVLVGNNVLYTVTVENNGPDDATGVILTDTLPADVTFVSSTPGPADVYRSGWHAHVRPGFSG